MMICAGFKIRPDDRDLTGVLSSTPEPDWLAEVPVGLHEHFRQAVGHQTGRGRQPDGHRDRRRRAD